MYGPVYATTSSPARYVLHQNYPNPFNPDTRILFSLNLDEHCELSIYNINGQLVRKLISGSRNAGTHLVMWDGRDDAGRLLPSGIYLYRLWTRSFSATKKMGFLR
jgi:flagellar hook assembly protein FlgD